MTMNWRRISNDAIAAEGYLISRYRLGETAYYTAWAPGQVLLLGYWGESADEAKAACERHKSERAAA